VQVTPLGRVEGDVVFATRDVPTDSGARTELVAIPIAGGGGRVVVSYPGYGYPWLTSRLSPDGRRFAFETDRGDRVTRIAIADLIAGSLSWLNTDDTNTADAQPAWDPSGTRIAFVRGGGAASSVWVVNVDGSSLRQIAAPNGGTSYMHQWTPDGRAVAFYQGIGYDIVDITTGTRLHMDKVVSADASWRAADPRLVARGWESAAGGDLQYVFVGDGMTDTRNVLVRASAIAEFVVNPRWRPGRDEFLYEYTDSGTQPTRSELRIRTLAGTERRLAVQAGMPVWSSDGQSVAYIKGESVDLPGRGLGGSTLTVGVSAEIRAIDADGMNDRLLFRSSVPPGREFPPNWCVCNDALAIRRY